MRLGEPLAPLSQIRVMVLWFRFIIAITCHCG